MQDFEKLGAFYLGRLRDASNQKTTPEPLLYDSKDLVTHAVCVGMTGSGKTGLCIDLIEEAAIDGVPTLIIDPKGDMANLLLQFPELRPSDFRPWVNEDDAKARNISADELASQQAELWRKGLESWGESGDRIAKLRDSAQFTIYTPGSSAGVPLSILKSFSAPPPDALDDRELFRDRVSGTATAVLSLLGIETEPMKSREHILLSTIFDAAWKDSRDLTIEDFVHQIQTPPVQRVGVLDLESFYPAKERFALAMSLNNLLASPGFESWLEGEPIDIGRLLFTPEGKPRVSILSIAHLSDSERMFVVSLVLNELLSWTRSQSGTTSLRAIFYMDEIFGYFPPVANPPSKRPLLTLLKQARAFGVGIVLATQNPVDLDYKGLANTGTWFIGRLQTERDKQRLLEGLEGASNESGVNFNRQAMERTLAGLEKRVFLLNNVHEDAPVLFESRWALSYLRGPLTRAQIRLLTGELKAEDGRSASVSPEKRPEPRLGGAGERSALPPDVPQAFIPVRGSANAIVYQPMLFAAAQVRYVDSKNKIDFLRESAFLTPIKDDRLPVEWEEAAEVSIDPNELETEPVRDAKFGTLPPAASNAKNYAGWQKDLVNWIYANQQLQLFCSTSVGQCSQPGETEAAFRARVQHGSREDRDQAVEKLRLKYQSRQSVLEDRLRRAQQSAQREREQSQGQMLSAAVDLGASLFGTLFGRKKAITAASSAVRSASRVRKDYGDVGRADETVESVQHQLADLNGQVDSEVKALQEQFDLSSGPLETISVKPKKTNITIRLLTLAWAPYTAGPGASPNPAWE